MKDRLIPTEELAERISVNVVTVRRWVREGRVKAIKLGRQWRIPPKEVDRILTEGISLDGVEEDSA